jgi:uracil-DNA glycosylase
MNEATAKDIMGEEWYGILEDYISSDEFIMIGKWIAGRRLNGIVYPIREHVFRCFRETPYSKVKVCIVSQDPYVGPAQATGIAMGIDTSLHTAVTPTLQNIVKELESDFNTIIVDFDYSLLNWCNQGCLMLNVALSVDKGKSGSHIPIWRPFTKQVFTVLSRRTDPIVFILLGREAQRYEDMISKHHVIMKEVHPVAEVYKPGAGFLGSKVFSRANEQLKAVNKEEIKWF